MYCHNRKMFPFLGLRLESQKTVSKETMEAGSTKNMEETEVQGKTAKTARTNQERGWKVFTKLSQQPLLISSLLLINHKGMQMTWGDFEMVSLLLIDRMLNNL